MTTKPGEPLYPLESEDEVRRLANQHEVIKDAMGELVLAPITLTTPTHPLRILDSATADGTWIRDLAASTAPVKHQFVGIDIDPGPFPAEPSSGQSYQVQDINKPWPKEWKESFDFVHQRLALAAAGPGQQHALNALSALVKPGGWIQLIEATNVLPEEDGPAMHNLVEVMKGLFSALGGSLELASKLPGWLESAGFLDVQSKVFNTRYGAMNPSPELGKQGVYATMIAAKGLSTFAKTLPAGSINLPPEKIDSLSEDLNKELTETGGLYPLAVVWARKPAV